MVINTGSKYWFQILVPNTGSKYWFQILVPNTGSKYWFQIILQMIVQMMDSHINLPSFG
jgi:hypothetical protein